MAQLKIKNLVASDDKGGSAIAKFKNPDIIAAIRRCRGLTYLTAQALGVSQGSLCYRISSDPELEEVAKEERGKTLDLAEAKLMQAVDKGEQWAITMLLRTLGRERGYVERQEVANVSTVKLEIVEEIVESGPTKSCDVTVAKPIEYRPRNTPEVFQDATTPEEGESSDYEGNGSGYSEK